MGFSNPWGLLALLALPVILLFYILKQRHKPKDVPSLWLWQKVLQQNAGYCWKQKLKWKTLLVLQLLAALCLGLALANPLFLGAGEAAHQIVVVDTSFSMSAKTETGTRLEEAKEDAAQYIRTHRGAFTVVEWNSQATVLVQQSQDQSAAVAAVEQLTAGIDGSNVTNLDHLLSALTEDGAQAVIFSDYPFSASPAGAAVVAYGAEEENLAVLGVSRRDQYLLAKVAAYHLEEEKTVEVALFGDGIVLDTQQATFSPENSQADVVFTLEGELPSTVSVRVMSEDALPGDDVYAMALGAEAEKRVLLVGDGNWYLEKALGALDHISLYRQSKDQPISEGFDLTIFDGTLPQKLPTEGQIWICNPPEGTGTFFATGTFDPQTNGVMGEPLAEYMDQLSFYVQQAKQVALPEGGKTVLSGQDGPLIWLGETGVQKVCVFTFDLNNSDLPLQQEFPILVYQLMQYFFPGQAAQSGAILGGSTVELDLSPSTKEAVVIAPDGTERTLLLQQPVFSENKQSGIYLVEETYGDGSKANVAFAVNVQTEQESSLIQAEQMAGTAAIGLRSGVSLQQFLLAAVLLLLLGEWWVMRRGH